MGNHLSTKGGSSIKRTYENKKNTLIYSEKRIVQNFTLIWLDETIDESKKDCRYTISQLRQIVNSITTCTDPTFCQKFIEKIRDEKIFLIVSGKLAQKIIEHIHHYVGLNSIYIFCGYPPAHEQLKTQWPKIRIVSSQIESICKSLVNDAAQCEQDLTPISILSLTDCSNQNLNQIDQSFMYSLLMKDILLETDYDEQAIVVLVDFCRKIFQGNEYELKIIDEFGRDYHKHTPIWWYTRECFTYKMLNRSLRMLEIDVIAAMGFFMKDIHQQLEKEHRTRSTGRAPFIVYRGQAMSNDEFEKIHKNINGLLTFNNLLSTSVDFKVAMGFAQNRKGQPDKVPILFEMQIDPILTTIPFASLKGLGYFHAEEEILFSMHTIFRITQVKENQDHIWQIKLDLVSDKDLQIGELIKRMRSEIGDGSATDRLARLMVTFGEFGKAETVYNLVLGSIPNDDEKALACIYNQLGYTQYKQGNHSQALTSYEDALKIQEKLRPSTDLDLANTYNNIGLLYANPNDSCKAVEYHQKALNIQQEHLDHNHPDLANTYNNLGLAQISMGDHKHGLDNLSAALRIRQISLPANHPLIASVYSTIGGVYQKLEDYSNALIFYKNALDIEEQASHSNHQTLAMAYYNMSTILNDLKQNDKAIQYAESAVQLASKFLEPNHPNTILFNEYFKELKTKQS